LHFGGHHRLILLFELGQARGPISAFALFKSHRVSFSAFERKYSGAACIDQQKTRRSLPARAVRVVSLNTLFWKILVT
jgi:hypothetical protein